LDEGIGRSTSGAAIKPGDRSGPSLTAIQI
jgi:hypothetical protein